tara:strand:+ start:1221 stop:1697 length:477 start_codon:yes stop_codon:yes gene_type:complete
MTHILVIDTDSYSGNFEREMTGFVTGVDGDLYDRGGATETRELHPELTAYFDKWSEVIIGDYVFNDEYGHQICGIMPTPGWSNNGSGQHTKLEPDEKRYYPAYQSVGIALNVSKLDEDVLETVRMLVDEFATEHKILILGYRMVTIETVTTTTEIELK